MKGLWISDLDRSNISNAYVSGMKEELHMVGNQFNASILIARTDVILTIYLYYSK